MHTLRTTEMKLERRIRSRAKRAGYRVIKSKRQQSLDNMGEFMLIDASTRFVVLGSRCEASLAEIENFLRD